MRVYPLGRTTAMWCTERQTEVRVVPEKGFSLSLLGGRTVDNGRRNFVLKPDDAAVERMRN